MSDLLPEFELVGVNVLISFVSDPSIGHGHFRLHNRTSRVETASIESSWLERRGDVQFLSGISVFNRKLGQAVDPARIDVDAMSTLEFYVGFPRIQWEPQFGDTGSIGIRVLVGGVHLEARSKLQFERRTPLGE